METKRPAVSDLFRNFNNAKALREHELTRRFFEDLGYGPESDALGVRRVKSAVSQALFAMEQPTGLVSNVHERRHAAIIRRCEFEGASHKEVASDLGIGLRHFFRELRLARATFAQRLQSVELPEEPQISGVVDLFELQLQRVRALMNACDFERAVHSAETLLEAVEDDERKLLALTQLAETHAECRNLRGLRSLERVIREMPKDRFPISRGAVLTRLHTLRARAAYLQGSLEEAAALCSPQLFQEVQMLGGARERALWASSLFESAPFHALTGNYKYTTAQVLLARDLVGDTTTASPMLRVRLLFGLAELNLIADAIAEAKTNLQHAYRTAVDHNLVSAAFDASMTLAMAEMFDGNRGAALRISREAVEAMTDVDIVDKPWFLILAARIEASCRGAEHDGLRRALKLLSQVRAAGSEAGMRAFMVRGMEAECYAMQGCYAQAALDASEALLGFRKLGMLRGVGYALRITAEVEEAMGNVSQARDSIVEAVEVLERHGPPRALRKALDVAGRVTGNSSYIRRAREFAVR